MTDPVDTLEAALLGMIRGQNSQIEISFNEHACNYCTVAEAIEMGIYRAGDWISAEDRDRSILLNRVWAVCWYPDSPVANHNVLASTLKGALAAALKTCLEKILNASTVGEKQP